jgi:hypothetical protein
MTSEHSAERVALTAVLDAHSGYEFVSGTKAFWCKCGVRLADSYPDQASRAHLADVIEREVIAARVAEAVKVGRERIHGLLDTFAEGAWNDAFSTHNVTDDVSAVEAMENWMRANIDRSTPSDDPKGDDRG